MESNSKTTITEVPGGKKLIVTRAFNAPLRQVWDAWTKSNLLDQWWAPKPWKAETKSMDFREGGTWIYAMVGPEGEKHWARADYETIEPLKGYTVTDAFCDEHGNINQDLPQMHWKCDFHETPAGTNVVIEITFNNEADLEKIIEMGFKEGFTSGLANLDELLLNPS